MTTDRRPRWRWIVAAAVAAVLVLVAIIAVPILTHQNQGESGQQQATEPWPLEVAATGADGRDRSFVVSSPDGADVVDTSSLSPGQQLVVSGTGYDSARGIYVAVCRIPDDAATKPGPCLGGVPEQATQEVEVGTVQYAPSNWVNDDWAWKLFGSRGYDDPDAGTFTAYLLVGEPKDDKLDCSVEACGIFTRNDHTALNDRVQDLYVPVGFATD